VLSSSGTRPEWTCPDWLPPLRSLGMMTSGSMTRMLPVLVTYKPERRAVLRWAVYTSRRTRTRAIRGARRVCLRHDP